MPTPLAKSWSWWVLLKISREGDDDERAEDGAGDRREAADHRHAQRARIDSAGVK